ncbi:MAG: AbrB family transcriptional regulator [Pseudomonadota bacterium]
MIAILTSFVVAGAGVGLFMVLGLPLPWLLGPMTACLGAALLGLDMKGIKPLNASMRTILGVAVGATITPAVLITLPGMWPTLVMIPILIIAAGVIGIPYFQRVWGYDQPTAYYSAMPGGLQDMVLFGEEAGGNVRTLSLTHATRVLIIVVAAPFLLSALWDAELSNPPGRPLLDVDPADLAIMVACAAIGWWGALKIRLFGASILGPLIAAAIASIFGWLDGRPPAEAIWAAQFFIGMTIGTKYTGISINEVRRDLTAAVGYCGILVILTLIFVEIIYAFGMAPGLEAVLAFAPGGQAEMTVLALLTGADAAFVVAHHILRIVLVITGAPLVMRWLSPKPPG